MMKSVYHVTTQLERDPCNDESCNNNATGKNTNFLKVMAETSITLSSNALNSATCDTSNIIKPLNL